MCLPTSVGGRRDDVIVITNGPITDPERYVRICKGQGTSLGLLPRGSVCVLLCLFLFLTVFSELTVLLLFAVRCPEQPHLRLVNADQLNAICNHDDLREPNTVTHPRAVHVLLGYTPKTFIFTSRVTTQHWVGRAAKDKNEKYLLFRKYKILNHFVRYYDQWLKDQAQRSGKVGAEAKSVLRKAWEQDQVSLARELEAGALSIPRGIPLLPSGRIDRGPSPSFVSALSGREEAEVRDLFTEGFPDHPMPPRVDPARYINLVSSSSESSVTGPLGPPSVINPSLARYKAFVPTDLEVGQGSGSGGRGRNQGGNRGEALVQRTRARGIGSGVRGDRPRLRAIDPHASRGTPSAPGETSASPLPTRTRRSEGDSADRSLSKRPRDSRGRELAEPFVPDFGDLPLRCDQSAFEDAGVADKLLSAMTLPTDLVTISEKETEALSVEGAHKAYVGLLMMRMSSSRAASQVAHVREDYRQVSDQLLAWKRRSDANKDKATQSEVKAKEYEEKMKEAIKNSSTWEAKAEDVKKKWDAAEQSKAKYVADASKLRSENADLQLKLKDAEARLKKAEEDSHARAQQAVNDAGEAMADQLLAAQNRFYRAGYRHALSDLGVPRNDPRWKPVSCPPDIYDIFAAEDAQDAQETHRVQETRGS